METRPENPYDDSNLAIEFKDLNGKYIVDPREEIRRNNQHEFPTPIDYRAIHREANIGFAELWGHRPRQEDRVAVGILEGVKVGELNAKDYDDIQRDVIHCLEKCLEKFGFDSVAGSTLCSVIIDRDYLYTANVGDSLAYSCMIGKEDHYCFRLNQDLHNLSNQAEVKRVKESHGVIINNRLRGGLALSRSMGDNHYASCGLIHEPDTYDNAVSSTFKGKKFVIVACDGMDNLGNKDIHQVIRENQFSLPDAIAKKLAEEALAKGSKDNISVCITECDSKSNDVKYMTVFDGHGSPYLGDYISELLSRLFYPVLSVYAQCKILEKCFPTSESEYKNLIFLLWNCFENASFTHPTVGPFYVHEEKCQEEKNIMKVKLFYEKYANFLRSLTRDLRLEPEKSDERIKKANKIVNLFAELLTIPKQISLIIKEQPLHLQEDGEKYFSTITAKLVELMEVAQDFLEKSNLEEIEQLYINFSIYYEEKKQLYKIVKMIDDIKRNYFKIIPLSVYNHPNADDRKRLDIISHLKQIVEKALQQYPAQSSQVIIQTIIDELDQAKKTLNLSSSFKSIHQFFSADERFKAKLSDYIDIAINQITQLNEVNKKLKLNKFS